MKKIVTRICGGLGNQMFSYAVGEKLARKYGVAQQFDLIEYFSSKYVFKKGISTRQFQLSCFKGPSRYTIWPLWKSLFFFGLAAIDLAVKHDFYKRILSSLGFHLYKSTNLYFPDGDSNPHGKSKIYSTWLMLSMDRMPSRQILMSEFQLASPLKAVNAERLSEIHSSTSVAVHVRRTDYLVQAQSWALASDYYHLSIRFIKARVDGPKWFVFSDDIPWCKKEFKHLENAVFVDGNADVPWEDMELMRSCRHHIIANSTFSWWSAYLAYDENGFVLYPTHWGGVAPESLPPTFVPHEWIGVA